MHRKYKKTICSLLISSILLVGYIGSFYSVRKMVTFTAAIPRDFSGRSVVRVYFFSQDKIVNQLLFVLYYPLHWHPPASINDLDSSPPPKTLYVEDLSVLVQTGAAGF